jgi:uncharacterized protein (TIGR00255 family)
MIYSMTGFGRSEKMINNFLLTVDVKSLNGKQFEINTRVPAMLKPYEIELKLLAQSHLQRGSIELNINIKQHGAAKPMKVNTELATYYYTALQQISASLQLPADNALQIIMAMPEVVSQSTDDVTEKDWLQIKEVIIEALEKLTEHRAKEGVMLQQYLNDTINNIGTLSQAITPFEKERMNKQKQKLEQLLQDQVGADKVDNNRLEQELIYYIEKLDINEEKSRLAHHIQYFNEAIIDKQTTQKGKKLGFILQEIGREINTMGSKASDADMQKIVVQMKDELEKAKEQVLNAL